MTPTSTDDTTTPAPRGRPASRPAPRRAALTALVTVLLVGASGCGAGSPRDAIVDRPLEERLVEVEARRICELEANAFSSLEDAESFVATLLEEVDVTAEQHAAFRDALADDPALAEQVSDAIDTRCP